MGLGSLVEQAIVSQIFGIAIVALVAGVIIGAVVMAVMRRRRSGE